MSTSNKTRPELTRCLVVNRFNNGAVDRLPPSPARAEREGKRYPTPLYAILSNGLTRIARLIYHGKFRIEGNFSHDY